MSEREQLQQYTADRQEKITQLEISLREIDAMPSGTLSHRWIVKAAVRRVHAQYVDDLNRCQLQLSRMPLGQEAQP